MIKDQIELGFINVPVAYFQFTEKQKERICNELINKLLNHIDKNIEEGIINRIEFLDEILEASIQTNNEAEAFEVSGFLYDCRKILNE